MSETNTGNARSATESIIGTFDYVWDRLAGRLEGLTDDEYFWEPVEGCWSLRQGADGVWRLDGAGGGGPPPDPVPFTTIAWRLGHVVGLAVGGFTRARFGSDEPADDSFDFPRGVREVPAFLLRYYDGWRHALAGLDRAGWEAPLGPSFGPYSEDNTVDLALHVLDEVVHHAAEIGVVRDLYSHRDELGRSAG